MNERREGFTLVETLIVVVLGAVVMGTIYQMIVIQEKTTRQQYAVVQTNENTQMALAVITNDLKEISARDGDVVAAESTSIQFRALRKAGVVCNRPSNSQIDVWELGAPFASSDSLLVFNEGPNANSANDDSWTRAVVTGTATVAVAACAANPLGANSTQRLTVAGNPFTNVAAGGLVRSFIPTRYRLVDVSGRGELRRTESGVETAIIENLTSMSQGGLRLRYFDSTGVQIPNSSLTARRTEIMRIQVKVAGEQVGHATATAKRYRDSLVTQVYLRGNGRSR